MQVVFQTVGDQWVVHSTYGEEADLSSVEQFAGSDYRVVKGLSDDAVSTDPETAEFILRPELAADMDALLGLDLASTIKRRRGEVDALLSQKLEAGGAFDGRMFELDEGSMNRMNSAFSIAKTVEDMGQTWPGMNWTTAANEIYAIADFQTFQGMIISLGAQGQALYAKWQEHKLAISALTDVDEINAYDIAAGW